MANFISHESDDFHPQYGGVNWIHRFNSLLESADVEVHPVAYIETEPMQITQENTVIYINQVADELDCVAVKYDQDEDDVWTFYYRDQLEGSGTTFEDVTRAIGVWSLVMTSIYPLKHVVEQYEKFQAVGLDTIPDWL